MIKLLKIIFCRHKHNKFLRNLYGDQINYFDARSLWVCERCGKISGRPYLHKDKNGDAL